MNSIVYNILSVVFIIGVVRGIQLMSSPKTARQGNLLGAFAMAGAMIVTLIQAEILNSVVIYATIILGGAVGYWLALKVKMTEMPQMVALLNALGGGASALVSVLVLMGSADVTLFNGFNSNLGLAVGAVTFSGSIVAAGKLAAMLPQRQVHLNHHNLISILLFGLTCVLILINTVAVSALLTWTLGLATLLLGVIITIRVGGADMPITISLLNSLSGVAGAIAGFATNNVLLVAVGAIIGASGLILTQIMCRAMNRQLSKIIFASAPVGTSVAVTEAAPVSTPEVETEPPLERSVRVLKEAQKVVIVPGYGMALAQAQHRVKELVDRLEQAGKEVKIAIHPVAGRMPGHMNVLLAEADLDYEKFIEIDEINPEFPEVDAVVVVGANDVVNPAANTAEGTPIYGMPVLNVAVAKQIIICNFDTKPGYAGVDNPLYKMDRSILLLGDAAESISSLNEQLSA